MALRDQPILDHHQGEVFRMPIDRRMVLLGPPGTGKTTTLIKRLAQKRSADALTDYERALLSRLELSSSVSDPAGWAMFSPTELLKQYLRDAFNREGVPATEGNLTTWARQRLALGRGTLRILRTPESGRFQLDESAAPLLDQSSPGITQLQEEFETFFNKGIFQQARDSLKYLRLHASDAVKRLLRAQLGRIESSQITSPRELIGILDPSGLQSELQRLQDENSDALKQMGNRLVSDHASLLDEMVEAMPEILGSASEDDETEDDDELSDETIPDTRDSTNDKVNCAKFLLSALRSRSRSFALERAAARGRVGRVLKLLGTRLPPTDDMRALGIRLVTASHLRGLTQLPRSLVMSVPSWFDRFRRSRISQARYCSADVQKLVDQRRVSPDEVDVMILTMLRNARLLLEGSRDHLFLRSRHDWLERIKNHYLSQVFVDEATDFSAVQLACTMELSDPRLRSWFACGDLNQRITHEGIRSRSEVDALAESTGTSIEMRSVKRAYRQSRRLRELAAVYAVDDVDAGLPMEDPGFAEEADVPPLLAEHCSGEALGEWVASRIVEVETTTGHLPSVAVFVHDAAEIDPIVAQLEPYLAERNIPVVGFKDGRAVGDASEIRVFDVRHVKGLEFEAVFYVGIDRLAESIPELFDRFFFVGISRAATYLGVTCEGVLPDTINATRDHFGTGGWTH